MNNRRVVFAAACAGMLLFGIVMISLGSLLPGLTARFSLNELSAASLASLLPFGILAGSVVFGPVVDRYGYKVLLIGCTLLVSLSLESIAFTESFSVLQASIIVIGFGGGVLNGATNALVADISGDERGAGLSFLGVFFGVGALGMPVVLGLLSKTLPQASILALIGIFVFLVAGAFTVIRFPVPKQQAGFPLVKSVSLLRDSTLLLLSFILFFESGMEGIVNNWTTTYLQHEGATSPENALFALSFLVGGLILARLVLSRVLTLVSMWTVLFTGAGIVGIGTLLLIGGEGYTASLVGLTLMGVGFAPVFPVILGKIGDTFAAFSGTAFSIALVIALIGNMILNYAVGVVAHQYGIVHFPGVVLVCLCLMVLLLAMARKRVVSLARQSIHA